MDGPNQTRDFNDFLVGGGVALRKVIAINVRALRQEQGLTLEQLGKRCKLNVQYIGRLEKSAAINVTADNLEKLAKGLQVSVAALVSSNQIEPASRDVADQLEQAINLLQGCHTRLS